MTEENKDSISSKDMENSMNKETSVSEDNSAVQKKTKWKLFNKLPKKNEKRTSNTQQSLSLKEAYSILRISHYPPTNEEIRIAYYREEYKLEDAGDDKMKELLKAAKETILENIAINPFTEEDIDEDVKTNFKTPQSSKWKNKIPAFSLKKTTGKKKSVSQIIGSRAETENTISLEPEKISTNKKGIIRFIVIGLIAIGILFISYNSSTNTQAPADALTSPETATDIPNVETDENLTNSSHPYINIETAIYLMQKDGITIDQGTLIPEIAKITDFASNQYLRVPGINIYFITREFILHNENASIQFKNYALYKHSETNSPETSYKKITDWTSYTIEDIAIDGEWTGECVINNKHTLQANNIHLSLTDNGYLTGEYSFFPESEQAASLMIEGYYNKESNEFTLYGKEWIKRPSLFVTPKLVGYYNPITDRLESNKKNEDTARFSFFNTDKNPAVINKQTIKHLLKNAEATYKTSTDSYAIPLLQLKEIKSFSVNDFSEDTCSITYDAFLDRDIVDYTVTGEATFYKNCGMWLLESHSAEAKFAGMDLAGTYSGTEIIEDKEYYSTYVIYPTEDKDVYSVHVTLKPGLDSLKKTEEIRSLIFIEKGIRMERTDIINFNILGDGAIESYMDYYNDVFVNDSGASLTKTSKEY